MAKANKTIRQSLDYKPAHAAWFAATKDLFNQVTAFYFEVIAAREQVLDFSNKEALTVLETLTHATQKNPTPIMPLEEIVEDIPAMFRRAAIHAALGSARSLWMSTCRIFLTNYGFHMSSSHATSSQEIDYVGVSEAAGL